MAENPVERGEGGHDDGYTVGELQYLLQAYQEQYSVLTRELKESSDAVMEISNAIEALDSKSTIASKESLVPAGAGLYFYAKTGASESVVVNIGGRLMIETDTASAKEIMNRRFNAQRENMNRVSHQMKQVEDTIYGISYRIDGLTAD